MPIVPYFEASYSYLPNKWLGCVGELGETSRSLLGPPRLLFLSNYLSTQPQKCKNIRNL